MKILKLIVLNFFFITIFSCNEKKANNNINEQKKEDIVSSGTNRFVANDSINTLLKNALQKGDTLSYDKAYHYFAIYHYKKEFLYYSMTMASKHNYNKAYFDTYYFFKFLNHDNGIDTDTNVTTYYLLKAYETNNENAKEIVKETYIENGLKIPDSKSFLQK